MKATEANLLKFMQKPKQMVIPIYQRKYSWKIEQCKKLWDDIEKVAMDEAIMSHFLGSIVYIDDDQGGNIVDVARYLLIDGQQRLTTMTLFLYALSLLLRHEEDITKSKIHNYYLLNNEEKGELRYKLLPSETDKETLLNLIDGVENTEETSERIMENFRFFLEQIRMSEFTPSELYKAIGKLMIVDTSLQRGYDDPQLIFESLNSTGLDLTETDKIRNYILMGLDSATQENLYKNYWNKIEKSFDKHPDSKLFDRFMKDYLSIKTGLIPKKENIYKDFVRYMIQNRGSLTAEELVKDIYTYARLYATMYFFDTKDTDVFKALKDIRELNMDVVNPFLLQVFYDYEVNKDITKTTFLSTVRLLESFLFRRSICDIATQGLNLRFVQYLKEIDKENYVESVHAALLNGDSHKYFPKDEQFKESLLNKDVYHSRTIQYLLTKLENHNRKETVHIKEYTVEHILPQNENLSESWQNELGSNWEEVQRKYLHTLGNLTLTGYNSEYSDRPFIEKRDMEGGFSKSPLKLNQSVATLDSWNETNLLTRANELAVMCCRIWSHPELSEDMLNKYTNKEKNKRSGYSLESHKRKTTEYVAHLFNEIQQRIFAIDKKITERINKQYVAYKYKQNVLSIVFQTNKLKLNFPLSMDDIKNPFEGLRDVSSVSTWGNGDVEVDIDSIDQIDQVMELINIVYQKQLPKGKESKNSTNLETA